MVSRLIRSLKDRLSVSFLYSLLLYQVKFRKINALLCGFDSMSYKLEERERSKVSTIFLRNEFLSMIVQEYNLLRRDRRCYALIDVSTLPSSRHGRQQTHLDVLFSLLKEVLFYRSPRLNIENKINKAL